MRFFFPDSQDQVDPGFNFTTEEWSEGRMRQRDDVYAHEALEAPAYTGILVSKAIVDGVGTASARYTLGQRHRLHRTGVRDFFRLDSVLGPRMQTMGDCGAFTYVREEVPPLSVDEVIDFYQGCGFDFGVSVDHVILGYRNELLDDVPEDWRRRQEITLELASDFLARHVARRCTFEPIGAAQGWSPKSYAHSVTELQRMGFIRIGLGGMVPLKTNEILDCLRAVSDVLEPATELHLFGVTRCEFVRDFKKFGVTSFDSTAPLTRAFKDARNNYFTAERTYSAIRVPQVDGNPKLRRWIRAGKIDQAEAVRLERRCLERLLAYDAGQADVEGVLQALREYEQLHDGKRDRTDLYREVLTDQPWKQCPCAICRDAGIHVILFRGSERNKRRGFHNLFVFNQQLQRELVRSSGGRRDNARTTAPGA